MPTPAEIANLFPKIGGPLRSQAEAEGLASSVANYAAIKSDAHGTKQLLRAEDVVDGDTTRFGRTTGFDTFESTIGSDSNEKAKKLLDLGITAEQQRLLGGQGKQVLTDYLTKNPGVVADITGHDVYGRQLLSSPQLTEHMVASGVAVPTDRYDEKLQGLYRKTQEKINKLDPVRGKAMEIQREYNIEGQKPGFFERVGDAVDAFQSGTQQAVVGTADFALDLLTPGGDNKLLNDLKSAKTANKMWGYDSREADFAKQEALHKFKNEEYGGAVLEMVKSPELWGESLPMMAEMMLGAGKFTKLGKMIRAETAGLQGAEKVAKIKDLKDKASVYDRVKHMAAGNVGYLATIGDQTNRHIEAFTENNEGVPPSYAQIAEMTAVNALQLGLDRFAFKEAFGLKGGVSKFKDNIKPLVDTVTPENIPSVVKSIAASSAGIATAMGTEAAQEYVQTWAEMLNEKAGTKKYGDWLAVLQNPEAQDEAIIGALAGAGMGAQMRGATEVASALTPDKRQEMIDAIKSRQVTEVPAVSGEEVQPTEVKPLVKTVDGKQFTSVTDALKKMDDEDAGDRLSNYHNAVNMLANLKDEGLGDKLSIENSLELLNAHKVVYESYEAAGIKQPASASYDAKIEGVENNLKNMMRGILKENGWDTLETVEEKFGLINRAVNAWATSNGIEIAKYRDALLAPMAELIFEDSLGSEPVKPLKVQRVESSEIPEGGLKINKQSDGGQTTGITPLKVNRFNTATDQNAKATQTPKQMKDDVKAVIQAKVQEPLDVEDISTETHSGLSARSIQKLAEAVKLPARQVKAALDIAAEKMLIKRMGSVSKEANKTQFKMYFGEDGILPNFMKYKRALQDGDVDTATDRWNSIQKRYIDQAYKAEVARRSMAETSKKVAEMYKDGKSIEEIRSELKDTSIGVQGAKGGDIVGHLGIDDVIKFTDSIPQEERDKLKFSDSGHIVEAEMESEAHLVGMAARERLELPTITIKETKRIDLHNSIVEKIKEIKEQIKTLTEAKGDLFKEMTEEELVEYSEIDKKVKKLQDILESRVKDLEKQANYIKSNRVQYTNITVGKDAELGDKVGQKVGTVTQEEAEELGIDEEFVEEFVPQKTENEYKKLLEEIKELKKERAKLQVGKREVDKKVKAHDTKVESLDKELANAEAVLGVTAVAPVKQAVEAAKKADGVVQKLADKIRSLKTVKKDLEAAEKFLAKNAEVFGSIVVDVQDLVRTQKAFNEWLKSPEGRKSSKEAQNAKIVELSKMSDTLHTITNAAIRMAKASVVFARRLMNLQGIKNDTNLVSAVKESLDKVNRDLANAEARLQAVKGQRAVNVQDAIKKVLDLRKGVMPEVDEVLDKKELKEVLKDATTLRKLKNKLYRVKDGNKEVIKKLSEEIREKEAELKGTRLFKATVENNMLAKDKFTPNVDGIENPLVLDDLTKSRGSILANIGLESLATMFDKGSDEHRYLESIINDTMKYVNKALYSGPMKSEKLVNKVLASNPALMLLSDMENKDGVVQFNFKPEMMQALRLITKNYLAVNSAKLKFNDDLAISKIIGVSEYDWRAIKHARPALKEQGQLLTIVASRIGDDFMRAMGISEGKIGEELYRKLVADIGNTGLRVAQAAGEVQIQPMEGKDWNEIAVKKVDNEAKVVFVKTGKTEHAKNTEVEMETLKNIDKMLDALNQQSSYRTHPIYAVQNKKKYQIEGSPFDVPEKSQEVLRVLEDQEYKINIPALTVVIEDYKKNTTEFLKRSGWVELDTILLKDDRDAQESKNRELEDVMEKLVVMLDAYDKGELLDGVFFNWFFSSNGRYMIDAVGINPQSDKHVTRWLLLPKEAVDVKWDLDNKSAQALMYDGIAQAFGFDIDKAKPIETKAFAEKLMVAHKLHKDVFENMVRTGKQLFKEDKEGNFVPATKEELADEGFKLVKIEMPHVGHAYMALEFMGRKLKAEKKGSKVFNATLAAEYDAKTSGPMHKLMQWPVLVDENGKDIVEEWLSKGAIMLEGQEFIGGSSTSHSQAITDGYQTVTIGAGKALANTQPKREVTDNNGETRVVVDYQKPYDELKPLLPTLVEIVEEMEKATKEGRTLGKEAFVPFGYGSSTATIQENVGVKLAYAVLNRVVDPNDTEMSKAFKAGFSMTESEYKDLQDALRERNTETISLEMVGAKQGGMEKNTVLIDVLTEMFSLTYGEAYKQAMESKFSKHSEINAVIKDVTSSMFRVWKMKYDKEIAKIANPTTEQKMEVIKGLEQFFPLIKAPWSESRADGVAIFDTKRSSMKNEVLPTVQTTTRKEDGGMTSNPVQAMITEMEEVFAAGAVLPIHWIDGSQIGSILKDGGVQGIHDAIVLGIPTEEGVSKIGQMNKAMYDINANYNLLEEFQNAFLGMVDGMTDKEIEEFMMTDKAMDLAEVKDTLGTLVEEVNAGRKKLYSKEMTVGNIIAFEGTAYNTAEDMKKYKAVDKVIAELIEGCK